MALLKVCTNRNSVEIKSPQNMANKGFTFIEMIIVMGLLVVFAALGLFMSMESLRGGSFRDDRDMAVSALQRARSLAMNNICLGAAAVCDEGKAHGVHFDPGRKEIVIFQGDDYNDDAAANEIIKFNNQTIYVDSSSPIDVIFARFSGNSSDEEVILRDEAGHVSKISVSAEGRIDWTDEE